MMRRRRRKEGRGESERGEKKREGEDGTQACLLRALSSSLLPFLPLSLSLSTFLLLLLLSLVPSNVI